MYYEGGATKKITIGRHWSPWGAINDVVLNGNVTCSGNFTNGSSSYIYAGGLRIGGFDTGNTLYNGTNTLGITALNNITFNTGTSLANYTTRMTINSAGNTTIMVIYPLAMV